MGVGVGGQGRLAFPFALFVKRRLVLRVCHTDCHLPCAYRGTAQPRSTPSQPSLPKPLERTTPTLPPALESNSFFTCSVFRTLGSRPLIQLLTICFYSNGKIKTTFWQPQRFCLWIIYWFSQNHLLIAFNVTGTVPGEAGRGEVVQDFTCDHRVSITSRVT